MTDKQYPTHIDLCDGKYTLIYDFQTGQSECLRYGEPWRQLVGDKMVLACFDEIVGLRQRLAAPPSEITDERILEIAESIKWPRSVVQEQVIAFARAVLAEGRK